MRLATTFIVSSLAALFVPSVAATQFPRPNTSRNLKSSAIASRQYRVPRDIIDICVSVDGSVLALAASILNPAVYANLNICLCLNDLDLWLDTSAEAQVFVNLLGKTTVAALIKQLLIVSAFNPHPQSCALPTHGSRICQVDAPCAFECDENFVEEEGACVCPLPFTECNGECGDFSTGCGSQTPGRRRRRNLPVTTLAQAKSTCKRNEAVCGIAGREDTLDFECVDTRSALDSCGGCVTPHPFYEPYRSTRLGVDCGRLPGVISASCAKSRCVVSRCRDSHELSDDKTHCVALPSIAQQLFTKTGAGGVGSLRLNKRQDVFSTVTAPNSDLKAQIEGVVNLVVGLNDACQALPTPDTTPAVDYKALVQATVDAATNLVNSNTVATVVANVNALVDVNTGFKDELNGCGCVEHLGLAALVIRLDAVLQAALDLQRWCDENPVGIPILPEIPEPGTSLPHTPSPIPNTSDLAIDLDLDALLEVLAGLISQAGLLDVDAIALVNVDAIQKISAVAQLILDLSAGATSLPPPPAGSSPIAIPIVGAPELPVDTNLAQVIVQAAINLLGSSTIVDVLANIQALVDVNAVVAHALTNCGCVDGMGLDGFVGTLDAVGQAALDLKNSINLDADVLGTVDLGLGGLLADLVACLDIVGDLTANVDLQTKLAGIVKIIVGLQAETLAIPSLLPSIPSVPSPGLPNRDVLATVVRATATVLASVTIPELLANVDALVIANVVLGNTLDGCRCVDALGLGDVKSGLDVVSDAATDLQEWCNTNTIIEPSSPGNAIVAHADVLIKALGAGSLAL